MYSRTRPTVYIVHWPKAAVIKAGYSERQRWRSFVLRGAEVVDLIDFDTSTEAFEFESVVLEMLGRRCLPAFNAAVDAAGLLGSNGGGHRECYSLPTGISPIDLLTSTDWIGEVSPR